MRMKALLGSLLACLFVAEAHCADLFRENFDQGNSTWKLAGGQRSLRLLGQQRQGEVFREGQGAELVRLQIEPGQEAELSHGLTPALAIADLRLAVWVRSSQPGARLLMRLVFPDKTDPETGAPLSVYLAGDQYRTANEWQQLTCTASPTAVQDAVRRVRYRLNDRTLSESGLYVDQAVLVCSAAPQTSQLDILFDELTLGPVIAPERVNPATALATPDDVPDPPVAFRLNRLTVEGEPFFPIMAPYHGDAGETAEGLSNAGINVAWVKDYRDGELLQRLYEAGLWSMATPPRVESEDGEVLDARTAGILPFGQETRPILFWNLGPRIPAYTLEQLIGWVGQIQAADSAFHRPTLADVTGGEYAFSNHVDLLAVSRHITNTAIAYDHYRDWLRSRRSEAFLNTFFWTWVQTEPAAQTIKTRAAAGNVPAVIEPEQIRLQVYAALQAGCRGIGYWKTIPLAADGPGMAERRLALSRLNLELKLLEPLLATGTQISRPMPFGVAQVRPGSSGRRVTPGYHQITMVGPQAAKTPFAPSEEPSGHADAVTIKTDYGPLLIAVWYGDSAQFCPGPMAANNVKIVVPGVPETASAWLLTPTGIEHLADETVTGGKQIVLNKFDQTAAVLFTADVSAVQRFRRAAMQMAPHAAQVTLELATAKRDRVAEVHRELSTLAPQPLPDGDAMLRRADQLLASAESALQRRDYDGARVAADDAMQMLRELQRAHWHDAVRKFNSPLASPHAICFSSLPDHYRLIAKVGSSILTPSQDANLLPSGNFNDWQEIADTWQHTGTDSPQLLAEGGLIPTNPARGDYALQLLATRKEGVPAGKTTVEGSVEVVSPPMSVSAGQVLHISGRIRVVRPIPSHLDGVTFHDNLLGPSAGLRWTQTKGWEQFQLLREVSTDGEIVLTITLHCEGEVHFDDIRVVPHTPQFAVAKPPGSAVRR